MASGVGDCQDVSRSFAFQSSTSWGCLPLYFVTAVWGGIIVRGFVVYGNAAATMHNFKTHEASVRASSALGLVSILLYLFLTALFYELLRPVSPRLSLLATLLSVTACGIQAFGDVFLAPLLPPAESQSAVLIEQARALPEAFLIMHVRAIHMALVIFGGFDVVIGILIFRSGLLPRIFGLTMALAGLGWLSYLWPPLADQLSRVVQPLGFLSEVLVMLWLLAKGVDEEQWQALSGDKVVRS